MGGLPRGASKSLEISVAGQQITIHLQNSERQARALHCTVWPAARKLVDAMVQLDAASPGFWKSKRTLELGAGTGIASISAAMLGATTVATDLFTDIITSNIQASTIQGHGSITVQCLNFAKKEELERHVGCYDAILVSDCCYNMQLCQQLLDALVLLSCRTCLISIPHYRSKSVQDQFVTEAASAGFGVEVLQDADGIAVYQLI